MLINKIILENIRSFSKPQPIELSTGVTLFKGDIGSGKSTILSAIEFALFGIGDVTGEYLLRHGASTGSVTLEFTANNKQYTVFRLLKKISNKNSKKGISIQQKEGYIIEESVKLPLAVEELKSKILKILKFNEIPKANTGSLIYRYAVFTPQEMMKEVLSQKVENRLDTLRRAFRIEDYNIIANNADILSTWLNNQSDILYELAKDVDSKRRELKEQVKLKAQDTEALQRLNSELGVLADKRFSITREIEANQSKKDEVQKLRESIPWMKEALEKLKENSGELGTQRSTLLGEINEIVIAERELEKIKPLYEEYEAKNKKLDELDPTINQIKDLNNQKVKLTSTIESAKNGLVNQNQGYTADLNNLTKKIKKQETLTAKLPELQTSEIQLTTEIANAPNYSELIVSLTGKYSSYTQNAQNKRAQVLSLESELKELQSIGIGAQCPKCKQQLTQQHYGKVEQDYLTELGTLKSSITQLDNESTKTNQQLSEAKKNQESLEAIKGKLKEAQKELAKISGAKDTLDGYQSDYSEKQALFQANEKALAEGNYASNEKAQLSIVSESLDKLLPIEGEYNEAKNRMKALEKLKVKEQYSASKEKIGRKYSLNNELTTLEGKITNTMKEIEEQERNIKTKNEEYELKKPILQVLANLETEKTKTQEAYENKNTEVIRKSSAIEGIDGKIKQLEDEIAKKSRQQFRSDERKQYELWINERFIPAVKEIERSVLVNIRENFDALFQNWFNHLIETGDITVRVDDNFTPIIEQNGYLMDVNSLSGGEKTSVALAYRLALNVIVKQVCDAMHSNLLILDEPTDGFSREQLFRLRDILNELKCEQVITVSHEAELEGFVDKIFRITKVNGESQIQAI
jgi:exonuclease SbcC